MYSSHLPRSLPMIINGIFTALVCTTLCAIGCGDSSSPEDLSTGNSGDDNNGNIGDGDGNDDNSGNGNASPSGNPGSNGTNGTGGGTDAPGLDERNVHVISTFDNGGLVGVYGDDGVTGTTQWIVNTTENDIFGCDGIEHYVISRESLRDATHLFAGMSADNSVTQGALFTVFHEGSSRVNSGNGTWEACATGLTVNTAPTKQQLDSMISDCNAGTTPSNGWVRECYFSFSDNCLMPGESNAQELRATRSGSIRRDPGSPPLRPGNLFPTACPNGLMGADPRWMIYRASGSYRDPFQAPGYQPFTLFRIALDDLPLDDLGDDIPEDPDIILL